MYWDDLNEGQVFTTQSQKVTSEKIAAFAQLSGDDNPLHIDSSFAANTPYKKPIAHGLLVLSIISGLTVQSGILGQQTTALTSLEWRFRKPVYADDIVHAEINVTRLRRVPGSANGLVLLGVKVKNQSNITVQTGTWQAFIQQRPIENPT